MNDVTYYIKVRVHRKEVHDWRYVYVEKMLKVIGKTYTPITFTTPDTYVELGQSVIIELSPN